MLSFHSFGLDEHKQEIARSVLARRSALELLRMPGKSLKSSSKVQICW